MKKKMILKTAYILLVCVMCSSMVFSSSAITVNEGYYDGLFDFINMFYRRDIGMDGLAGSSLNGVMEGMSPYSCFELAYTGSDEALTGIGANLEKVRQGFIVVSVNPSSPAYEAGLEAGDVIIRVDKLNASAMGINTFKSYLNGRESVLVESVSHVTGKVMAVKIGTAPDYVKDVDYVILDDAGYIRLNSFSDSTADVIEGVIGSLDSLGIENIILDLRDLISMNIEDAAKVAGVLSDGGTMARTRAGTYNTPRHDFEYNVVLLINESTIGAGEIIASAVEGIRIGQETAGNAVHIVRYPVFTESAYVKYSDMFNTSAIPAIVNQMKSRKMEPEASEISGYLNLVESGVFYNTGKPVNETNKIIPDVVIEDTSIGYMDYKPGKGMIDIARDYAEGSVNYDVFLAKKVLASIGVFNGPMTVVFGTEMTEAVNAYKASVGYPEDGILDKSTQAMLNTYSMKTAVLDDACVRAALDYLN